MQFFVIFAIFAVGISSISCRFDHRQIPVVKNEIENLDASCDANYFNVTITLSRVFKGKIFAKDFSGFQNCSAFGEARKSVFLSLPTNGCGIRLNNEKNMEFVLNLSVQNDKFLHQLSDQEVLVKCRVNPEQFSFINNKDALNKNRKRNGRMKHYEKSENMLKSGKAWMEIVAEDTEKNLQKLQVGEPMKLSIKSTLPLGIGWKIVDCSAHDGIGDSSQKLIDESGCPVDEQIMPKIIYKNLGDEQNQNEASTVFPAFKFPDRDRLHLNCNILLCKNKCSKRKCGQNQQRSAKEILDENDEEILDQIEIFNSVEVLAPTINEQGKFYNEPNSNSNRNLDSSFTFKGIPGDETLCISYNKVAITFCVIGLFFLIAVLLATAGLLKTRRHTRNALSVYTRSIFSTSSGCSYDSKLLNDQSSFGFSSTTGGLHYGRI